MGEKMGISGDVKTIKKVKMKSLELKKILNKKNVSDVIDSRVDTTEAESLKLKQVNKIIQTEVQRGKIAIMSKASATCGLVSSGL